MQIPNITRTKLSYEDYVDGLKAKKYRLIGYGAFAQVYAKKGGNTVIKVGLVDSWHEDGYVAFLKALDPSNKLFPKIHSVYRFYYKNKRWSNLFGEEIEVSDRYYVVEMERLVPLSRVKNADLKVIYERHGITSIFDFGQEGYGFKTPKFKTKRARTAHQILSNLYKKYDEDIHDNNVMIRQGKSGKAELVITDPVSFVY